MTYRVARVGGGRSPNAEERYLSRSGSLSWRVDDRVPEDPAAARSEGVAVRFRAPGPGPLQDELRTRGYDVTGEAVERAYLQAISRRAR